MKIAIRMAVVLAAATWVWGASAEQPGLPGLEVYKSPRCGCCAKWVRHMNDAGFPAQVHDADALQALKAELGVPRALDSCHTAVVEGYFIEGHVPAADVRRLLEERPDARGLALPDMPIGSPGMEGPDPEAYEVLLVGRDGSTRVWSRHEPNAP